MPGRSSGVTASWSRFRTVIVRDGVYGRAVKETETSAELTVRSLAPETPDAFASLAERHIGVWAGAGARGSAGAYPQDTAGRQITASFLYNATRSLFKERATRHDRHGRAGRAPRGI